MTKTARSTCHAQVMCILRVFMFVSLKLVVDVVCLMLVLSAFFCSGDVLFTLFIHPACIENLSPCCHRCLTTPPFNNSSFSPLVDLYHSRCMNRLGTPQCSDASVKFVSMFQIGPLCNSFENLLFDRSNRRLSFQSLRNCFVICQRSSSWLFASQSSSCLIFC